MKIVLDNEGFFYFRYVNALIFTDEYNDILNEFYDRFGMPNLLFLAMLNVTVLNLDKIIDDDMERNILNLVKYFKDEYSNEHLEEKNEVFNLCNEIISYVNNNKFEGETVSIYCAKELARRGYSIFDRVSLTSGKKLLKTFEFIKKIQVQDLYVLSTLYDDKTGDLYELNKEKYANPNLSYMSSIKINIEENPYYLDDKVFVQRVNEIIKLYEQNLEIQPLEKDIKIKVIKKNLKNLKEEIGESTNK